MNKHTAIIQGEVRYVKHYLKSRIWGWSIDRYITKESVLDEYRTIWEGELNSPMLDEGDTIYISKIDERVKITKRIIDIDSGKVTYETDHVIETVENEETKKSLLDAEKLLERHKQDEREWEERKLQIEKEAKEEFEAEHGLKEYFKNDCEPKKSWFERLLG